jgi:2-hydroxychromene-2-carboxylate isomerase
LSAPATATQPVFYYDLGSPQCYIAAERMASLPIVPEWEPAPASALGGPHPDPDRPHIERLASELGLQPVRWPPSWPPDTETAMLAATYAKGIGRAVAFSLAAFRQAFAAGRDLGDRDTVLIAGAASELHPTALLKAIALRSVAEALDRAGRRAREAGARSLPAIQVGECVFEGEAAVEDAARALARALLLEAPK